MRKTTAIMAVVMCMAMLLTLNVFAADVAPFTVEVPYGNPTVDGVITQGEWSLTTALNMNADTCTDTPWGNGINASCVFYYTWSEEGLYIAADVTDSETQLAADASGVYGNDAFQLAVNPGKLIADGGQGVFFSIGMTQDGTLGVMRHNYADADGVGEAGGGEAISKFTGKGQITETGWQFELLLPWDQVHVAGVEGAEALVPAGGLEEGFLLCYLDRPSETHFKTGAGFTVEEYYGTMILRAKPEETAAPETEAPATEAPAAETQAPAADAPVQTPAAQTADTAIIAAAVLVLAAGAVVVASKRK